jgi:hypothetical protein
LKALSLMNINKTSCSFANFPIATRSWHLRQSSATAMARTGKTAMSWDITELIEE